MQLPTPEQVSDKLNEHPVEAGAALVLIGLLLKMTFVIKLIAYGLITFGLIFLWKGLRPRFETNTSSN